MVCSVGDAVIKGLGIGNLGQFGGLVALPRRVDLTGGAVVVLVGIPLGDKLLTG